MPIDQPFSRRTFLAATLLGGLALAPAAAGASTTQNESHDSP
jgi:hypothetical protein